MRNRFHSYRSGLLCLLLGVWLGFAGCTETPPPGMVLIPSGYFSMGSDEEDTEGHALSLGLDKPWFADESPQRRIHLDDFYIDRYEVTNLQYYIFTQATDHRPPSTWGGRRFPDGQEQFPVTGVTFFDATDYAQWAGKRLPTEQEWEKAARGSVPISYPWGDVFDPARANISRSPTPRKEDGPRPVGSYPEGVSPYGVHDMIGNVWEWVWDYYQPYPESTYSNKEYQARKVVVRGLSYLGVGHFSKKEYMRVVALKARVAYREKLLPVARRVDVGFRCAMDRPTFYERYFAPPGSGEQAPAKENRN